MELLMTVADYNIVIPTGASLSDKEREAQWRDPAFQAIFVKHPS